VRSMSCSLSSMAEWTRLIPARGFERYRNDVQNACLRHLFRGAGPTGRAFALAAGMPVGHSGPRQIRSGDRQDWRQPWFLSKNTLMEIVKRMAC
jgi:hypothetical protein